MRIAVWCNIGGGFWHFPFVLSSDVCIKQRYYRQVVGENPGFKNQQNKIVLIKRTKMTAH